SSHKEAVAKEEQACSIGQRLGQNREVHAPNPRTERKKPKGERQNPWQQHGHEKRERETGERLPECGQVAPTKKNKKIRDRFVVLAKAANHAHEIHANHVTAE